MLPNEHYYQDDHGSWIFYWHEPDGEIIEGEVQILRSLSVDWHEPWARVAVIPWDGEGDPREVGYQWCADYERSLIERGLVEA